MGSLHNNHCIVYTFLCGDIYLPYTILYGVFTMCVPIYKIMLLCFLTLSIYIPEAYCTDANAVQERAQENMEGKKKTNHATQQTTTVHTDEVVVSATKVDKELLDVPISVSTINSDNVQKSGARTIGDVLKDVPGVELTSDGTQGLKRISIRGEKTSGTLILIDGQRIVENKSVEGTPILIDPSRIERIEVIKGPASVLYGADAMGGVVNIITKKGGKKAIEGEVFTSFNSNTFGFTEGLSLFGASNGFTYRASVAQNDQGNLTTPQGKVPNTRYSNTDASLYLDYTFLKKYTVGISYDYYHANIHGTIEPIALDGTRYNAFETNMPDWERHKVSTFFMAKDITQYLSRLRVDLFIQENIKDFNNIVKPYVPIAILAPGVFTDSKNINQQLGFSVQSDWLLGESTLLITGYELEYDVLNTRGNAMVQVMNRPQGRSAYKARGRSITNALYMQGETSLPQDFVLNYGSRLSVITAGIDSHSGNLLRRNGFGVAYIPIVASTKEKTYVYPVFNVGVMYTGFDDTTLRLSFAQGFRAPSLQERFLNTVGAAEAILANAKLKPESSHTVEFGSRYFANDFKVDITTFYTFTENYITAQPIQGTSSAMYKNVGKAHSIGIEGDIRYTIAQANLTPYTTITFIKRLFDYGVFRTWSTGTPEVSGRFGLLYENDFFETYGFTFYADVFANYGSSASYTQPKGDVRQTLHVGSYITANIHTGIRFGEERQYSLDLLANNILNTQYISPVAVRQVGAGYLYEPGAHVIMQVSARF